MNSSALPIPVANYLKKYGMPGWTLETAAHKRFNNIVVIPAIQEYENLKRLFDSLLQMDKTFFGETLFVVVVNNRSDSSEEVKKDNERSIEFIRQVIGESKLNELAEKRLTAKLNLGLADASSPGKELPEKDAGVGLARKIGMDLALNFFDYSNGKKKILICLDADCTVEENYLSAIVSSFNERQLSAGYVRYEHWMPNDEKERSAIICYEIFLRYYTLGLKYANSPFAFPTIGSTMVCDADSYVKIGGMNKKKAAEDFYFLEKLAKITTITGIETTKVYPSSRGSWRVPFGTGQRINRYFAGTHQEYILYDPLSFEILKRWINIFNGASILSSEEYLGAAKSISDGLYEFLVQNSFDKDWNSILKGSKSKTQIQKQKIIWFDGFRTLKLIHFLRDFSFPQTNMFDALDKIFSMMNYNVDTARTESIPEVTDQLEYLYHLRKIT